MLPGVVKNWRGVDGSMPTVESYPPRRSVPWRLDGAYLEGAKAETAAGVWMAQFKVHATTGTRNSDELEVNISDRSTRTLRELNISQQREMKAASARCKGCGSGLADLAGKTAKTTTYRYFWCLYFPPSFSELASWRCFSWRGGGGRCICYHTLAPQCSRNS